MNKSVAMITEMDALDLLETLSDEHIRDIPAVISCAEELQLAGDLLCRYGNSLSYLYQLKGYIGIVTRRARSQQDKASWEEMVSKKDAVEAVIEAVEVLRTSLSRAITSYTKSLDEIYMSEPRARAV